MALPGQGHSERRRNVHEQGTGILWLVVLTRATLTRSQWSSTKMAQGLRLVALSQVGQLQLGLASWFTSGWRCEEPCRGVSRVPSARVELPRHGERDSAEVRWMLGKASAEERRSMVRVKAYQFPGAAGPGEAFRVSPGRQVVLGSLCGGCNLSAEV